MISAGWEHNVGSSSTHLVPDTHPDEHGGAVGDDAFAQAPRLKAGWHARLVIHLKLVHYFIHRQLPRRILCSSQVCCAEHLHRRRHRLRGVGVCGAVASWP